MQRSTWCAPLPKKYRTPAHTARAKKAQRKRLLQALLGKLTFKLVTRSNVKARRAERLVIDRRVENLSFLRVVAGRPSPPVFSISESIIVDSVEVARV